MYAYILVCLSIAVRNTMTKSCLEERGFISSYGSQTIIKGSEGQSLKPRPQRKAVCWFYSFLSMKLPFLHSPGPSA